MKGFRLSLVFEFAALVVLLSVVKGIFQYWMRVILIGISRDIEFDLRNDLFAHLETLSYSYYQRTRTGDIMARVTNDLNAVRMLLVRVAAEKALPFEVRVPNATTVKAMRAADRGQGKRFKAPDALFKDLGI